MRAQDPPTDLDDEGKAFWWQAVSIMNDIGTLDRATAGELRAYCAAQVNEARFCRGEAERDDDAFGVIVRFIFQTGLSSLARSRMGTPEVPSVRRRIRQRDR